MADPGARAEAAPRRGETLSRRVAILGAGRLGESLVRGFLRSGWRAADDLVVTVRRPERLAELRERYGVEGTHDNEAAAASAPLVIVSVKPQDIAAVLTQIAPAVDGERTLLSMAAGITTSFIESRLPDGARVVRAMPNAPALVDEGIAGICGGAHARAEDLDLAEEALGHLGSVVRVAEVDMDAVTAISGSGPAYFALLAEAMIEAGLLLGLSRDVSTRLVVQTMFGSARLLRDESMHPVELREAVTSPGGTTTRAIRELERSGVRAAFLSAISAATERSRELAEG
ncbi:MAG TPA: pyrroline-5-carboxylate reductase [Gaiellaceae bacterium]|nr:pyrroline-5-carboxylate reductase [Gaiellaceae bacterium]